MFLIIVYGKILLLFQEKALKWKNFMFVVPISPKRGYTIENDNKIECFGIVGMASVNMKDGFAQLLKRDNVSKGVHIKINDNKIYIDFHIIVVYGVSIATVTENLIQNVKYRVEKFTGMSVEKINIYVEGVRIVD